MFKIKPLVATVNYSGAKIQNLGVIQQHQPPGTHNSLGLSGGVWCVGFFPCDIVWLTF